MTKHHINFFYTRKCLEEGILYCKVKTWYFGEMNWILCLLKGELYSGAEDRVANCHQFEMFPVVSGDLLSQNVTNSYHYVTDICV